MEEVKKTNKDLAEKLQNQDRDIEFDKRYVSIKLN